MSASENTLFLRAIAQRVPFIGVSGRGKFRRVELDLFPTDLELPQQEAAEAIEQLSKKYATGKGRWGSGPLFCVLERIPAASAATVVKELEALVKTHGRPRRLAQ